jgi:hypothetical protein
MTRPRARLAARRLALLLGGLAAAATSSCDNPACVFGPTVCQEQPGGGANAVASTFPATGEYLATGGPRVEAVYPSGTANPEAPVVIVFSESISPASIAGSFEIRPTSGIGTTQEGESALVGDGRVLIIVPTPLVPGQSYQVAFAEDAPLRDLSGAVALKPSDGVVGSFTVDPDPPTTPRVLMTWPPADAVGVSAITEIVTVFDRIMDPLTFSQQSWSVLVDGLDPAFDPLPEMLEINGGVGSGGATVQETRVWRWRSVDPATDARQALGTGLSVALELSGGIVPLATPTGEELEPTTIPFTLADAAPPAAVEILSDPTDAIGSENLSGVNPLMVGVDFDAPFVAGDVLEMFVVGSNPDDEEGAPALISIQREVALTEGDTSAVVEAGDLGLVTSVSPLVPALEDGAVALAFGLRRGGTRTALRVLDVDLTEPGLQDPVLDTVPPEFLNLLGYDEGEVRFSGDLRELALAGFASEEPRSVEVIAMLSGGAVDNRVGGALPPLPAFDLGGAFVAAPVDLGIVDRSEFPLDVSVIVYDRALNPSAPFMARFTQRGGSGGAGATALPGSGSDVGVTVYDAETLAPIAGATLIRHESIGGVISGGLPATGVTDATGFGLIASAPTGDTLITVEAAGYDLFTFQGVPTTRLDVPLTPAVPGPASSVGVANSVGQALSSAFIDNVLADSRVLLPGDTAVQASSCAYNTLLNQTTCQFPPRPLRPNEVGAASYLATKEPADPNDPSLFSAGTFLQAFELRYPRVPVVGGAVDALSLQVTQLLSAADVPPSESPLATAPQVFAKPPNAGLDFPDPDGPLRVSVEALAYGVRGMVTVGLGLPYFDVLADGWEIRAAYSARAAAGGELASGLAIEDERLLRVELVDVSGNRSGVRQRMSAATGDLQPPGVPFLQAPVGDTGGEAYDLVFEDVFGAPAVNPALDGQGLYRALLLDSGGRRWHLWTPDPVGGATVTLHVPPIAIVGGTPLASGAVTCFLDAWAWDGFDASDLLWSDVTRRHDAFSTAFPKVFSQP